MFHLIDFCRLCLSFNGEFSNMCNDDIMEKVVACISDLEFDEQLPALICTKCSEQLDLFFEFRNRCLRSEFLLNCYIDKFPRIQACNKFANTKLKVNVLKNFAASKKLLSNVQISKEHSSKSLPLSSNSKKSPDDYNNCKVILKDVRGSLKSNSENSDLNSVNNCVIKQNESSTSSKPSENTHVNGNINTNASNSIFNEDEDDIFFEEEDEDETSHFQNSETENVKRKSADNLKNSLNKKSNHDTNSPVINSGSCETEQANQLETNYLCSLERDALLLNMQTDITERVKLRKRKVQIHAQEKIKEALHDKAQAKAKKPDNLQRHRSPPFNKNSHKSKTKSTKLQKINGAFEKDSGKKDGLKNAKFQNFENRPASPNIEMNNLNSGILMMGNSCITNNIEKLINDKLQSFNSSPVTYNINIANLINAKLLNFKNSAGTIDVVSEAFKDSESEKVKSSAVTHKDDSKDAESEDSESNCVFAIQHIDIDNIEDNEWQEIISIPEIDITDRIEDVESQNLRIIATDEIKDIESQYLQIGSVNQNSQAVEVDGAESQNLQNSYMTHSIQTNKIQDAKLQNLENTYVSHNIEKGSIVDDELQNLRNIEIAKINDAESQNLRNNRMTHDFEKDAINTAELQNLRKSPVTHNIEADKIRDTKSQNLKSNPVTHNLKAGSFQDVYRFLAEKNHDANSQSLKSAHITHSTESAETQNTQSHSVERIPMTHSIQTHSSGESLNLTSDLISHNIEINKMKDTINRKLSNIPSIDTKVSRLESIKVQHFKNNLTARKVSKADKADKQQTITDYEKEIAPHYIPTTTSPPKEKPKPFVKCIQLHQPNRGSILKHHLLNNIKLNEGRKKDVPEPKPSAQSTQQLYQANFSNILKYNLTNRKKVPLKIVTNTDKMHQFTWKQLKQAIPTTNKQLKRPLTNNRLKVGNAQSLNSLFDVNRPLVGTDETVLTPSNCQNNLSCTTMLTQDNSQTNITYQTVITESDPQSTFAFSIEKPTPVQNSRKFSILGINPSKTGVADSSPSKKFRMIVPKLSTVAASSNELCNNPSVFAKPRSSLLKTKKTVALSNRQIDVGNGTFENPEHDTLNVQSNVTIPLCPGEFIDDENSSLLNISEKEFTLPGIRIDDVYSLTENTAAAEHPPSNFEYASLVDFDINPEVIYENTVEIVEPPMEIKEEPKLSLLQETVDCDSFIVGASLWEANSKEKSYMPHNSEHNYSLNKSDFLFLNETDTSPLEISSVTSNKVPMNNAKIKKKNVSTRMNRLLHTLKLQKEQCSKLRKMKSQFVIDDPLNVLQPIKYTPSRIKRSKKKVKRKGGKCGKKKNKDAPTDELKRISDMRRDEGASGSSNDLNNLLIYDSEGSEIDVETVPAVEKNSVIFSNSIANGSYYHSVNAKLEQKKIAGRERRITLRRNFNFLCSVLPKDVIASHCVRSVKEGIDAAIYCIKYLKLESKKLKEDHHFVIDKQERLKQKLEDMKKEAVNTAKEASKC